MRTYFVQIVVWIKGGVERTLQHHGVISTQKVELLHYERDWFVLVAAFREVEPNLILMQFDLHDLRMDDTWSGVKVVNALEHKHYKFAPYETYVGRQYAPDAVTIVVHIDRDMGVPPRTATAVN